MSTTPDDLEVGMPEANPLQSSVIGSPSSDEITTASGANARSPLLLAAPQSSGGTNASAVKPVVEEMDMPSKPCELDAADEHSHLPTETPVTPIVAQQLANEHHGIYATYGVRWYGLLVSVWLSFANSMLWICFAPIASITETYFNVSSDAVNGFSTMFLGCFGPGYIIALWGIEKYGVKRTLIAGALSQALGSWIRVMSLKDDHQANAGGYGLCMFGQSLAAIAAPLTQVVPCRYALEWFPLTQISVATTIGVIANPLGTAIGEFLPTVLVDENGGMRTLMLSTAIFASVGAVMSFFFPEAHQDLKPFAIAQMNHEPHALKGLRQSPNEIQEATIYARISTLAHKLSPAGQAIEQQRKAQGLWQRFLHLPETKSCIGLMKNRSFLLLFLGYVIGVGLANAFVTLIEQMIRPDGYSKDSAGSYGGLIILFGMVGSMVSSVVLDRWRKHIEQNPPVDPTNPLDIPHRVSIMYRNVLRFFLLMTILSVLFTLLSMRPDNSFVLGVSFAIVGFFVMPLLPIMILLASDCAPDIPADASTGMLQVGSNYGGIILVVMISALIHRSPDTYENVVPPSSIGIFCFLFFCVIVVGVFYNYRVKPDQSLDVSDDATNTSPDNQVFIAQKPETAVSVAPESQGGFAGLPSIGVAAGGNTIDESESVATHAKTEVELAPVTIHH